MKKIQTIILFFVVLSLGCTFYNINSEDITDNYHPPKSSLNEVEHVQSVDRRQAHEIIGYVTITTERRQAMEMQEVIDLLKQEAAILGGDAITEIETDATGFWKRLPAQKLLKNAYIRANFRAKVVAYQ